MKNAIAIPTATSVANRSTMNRNHGASPISGSVAPRSTIAIIASTIVGNSTRNPQKMKACITPGSAFWKSFRWPSTCTSSRRARVPT